jgi:hypothetical protein
MSPDSQPRHPGKSEQPRIWLIGAFVAAGCLSALLLYWVRPQQRLTGTERPALEVRIEEPLPPVREGVLSKRAASQPDSKPGNVVENAELRSVATSGAGVGVTKFWELEPGMRGTHLSLSEPSSLAAILDSLTGKEKETALQALRETVDDQANPGRLQALQGLLNWRKLDEPTLSAIFDKAIRDPDPAFVNVAIANLASREDREASEVLSKAYAGADASTRLLIVQSLGVESSAAPLLQQAISDPDENIRTVATAILSPGIDKSLQGTQPQ